VYVVTETAFIAMFILAGIGLLTLMVIADRELARVDWHSLFQKILKQIIETLLTVADTLEEKIDERTKP